MWKKLLKYMNIARELYKVVTRNGLSTFFWYDTWSSMGCLIDITGHRGIVNLGIGRHHSVADAGDKRRRRPYRQEHLNTFELNLQQLLLCYKRGLPLAILYSAERKKIIQQYSQHQRYLA